MDDNVEDARDVRLVVQPSGRYINLERFSDHIDLLLACVYSPSLQGLLDRLLALQSYDLQLWIDYNERHIEAVCELVLSGLEYDFSAITLLEHLSKNKVFRDQFLQLKPQLLHGLLKASTANERAFERYSPCIVALLSRPLPRDFVVPATLQGYVSLLVQGVTEDHEQHLRGVEIILRNYSKSELTILNPRQEDVLIQKLKSILGSGESTNWRALSCLASLSTASAIRPVQSAREDMLIRFIFTAEKGKKIARLVMSTINYQLSCEPSTMLSRPYDDECVLLQNILQAIDGAVVTEWLESREGSSLYQKIIDKVENKLCSLTVSNVSDLLMPIWSKTHASLANTSMLATGICRRAITHIAQSNNDSALTDAFCRLLDYADPTILKTSRIIEQILKAMTDHDLWQGVSWDKRSYCQALHNVTKKVRSLSGSRRALAESVMSNSARDLLQIFVNSTLPDLAEQCSYGIRSEMNTNLCSLIIEMQCDSLSAIRLELPMRTITRLLSKVNSVIGNGRALERTIRPKTDSVFFQETKSTPSSGIDSQHWKNKLMVDLQRDAAHQHTSIVARMNTICRDLECRAEINEQPLHDLQAKLDQAEALATELQARLAEASTELQQRDTENLHVFEERQRLEGVISDLLAENKATNAQIATLESSFALTNQQLQEAEQVSALTKHALDESQAAIRLQQEIMANDKKMMESELQRLQDKIAELRETLQDKHAEAEEVSALHEAAQARLVDTQTELTETRRHIEELKSHMKDFRIEKEKSEDDLRSRLDRETSSLSDAQEELGRMQGALAEAARAKEALIVQIERTESLADEKMSLQDEKHASMVKSLEDQIVLVRERGDAFAANLETENTALRKALVKIKASYEKRCEEFEKAKDLSRRLMAVTTGAFSQSTPSAQRKLSIMSPAEQPSTIASKRHKSTSGSPSKKTGHAMSESDETVDLGTATGSDKENRAPHGNHQVRRSFGREDTAILSQLSGLGI